VLPLRFQLQLKFIKSVSSHPGKTPLLILLAVSYTSHYCILNINPLFCYFLIFFSCSYSLISHLFRENWYFLLTIPTHQTNHFPSSQYGYTIKSQLSMFHYFKHKSAPWCYVSFCDNFPQAFFFAWFPLSLPQGHPHTL
jgi:hypothetical protein